MPLCIVRSTMSLVIDSNLEYIQQVLNISSVKMETEYSDMTVEEILEAEAAQGNQQAIKLAQELLTNTNLIIELFDLADNVNKLLILNEMSEFDLREFLPRMEDKDLLQGLNFFTTDKLLKLLEELPKEELVNTVFQMFSQEEIVQMMPDDQLNKFLTSTDIDKNKILKHMQSIPSEYLIQVLEQVTGEPAEGDLNNIDLTKQIGNLHPLEFKDVLTSFQPTQKQQLVLSLAKEHNEWFQLFDADAYTAIINREKQKNEVVKAMSVVEPEHVEKMLQELPRDLLSIVITQIDTDQFAHVLIEEHPEILAQIILK